LTAEQVSGMVNIGPHEQDHIATCPWCKSMMAAAQPTSQEFEEILRKMKNATEARRQRQVAAY
jgi:glutaredoxin